MKKKIRREKNEYIFNYQRKDVNEKLSRILGRDFKKYREDFQKTQNYLKTKFVPDFPIMVSLGTVNRCNLNCIMCYKEYHRQPKYEFSLETIKKIIDECKENKLSSIALGLDGEPLIDKHIKETIEMIGEAGIQDVFFTTNGVLLTDEVIELMIKNRMTRLRISIDAARKETYKKIRGFDMLGKIEENIDRVVALKKKYKSVLPTIRLSFVVMDANKDETKEFIKKWENKVDCIDFQRCIDFSHVDVLEKIKRGAIKRPFCPQPFYLFSIWADGGVSPCCTFYGRKLIVGNIYNQSIKEIWMGKKIKEIREQILNNKFNNVCRNCLYFRDEENIENSMKTK